MIGGKVNQIVALEIAIKTRIVWALTMIWLIGRTALLWLRTRGAPDYIRPAFMWLWQDGYRSTMFHLFDVGERMFIDNGYALRDIEAGFKQSGLKRPTKEEMQPHAESQPS